MRSLQIRTVSQSMMDHITGTPIKLELFNFELNKKKIKLNKQKEHYVGTDAVSWIRVFDEENNYYDFVTSSVFYISNKKGVLLFCSEDTEYISFEYISVLIEEFMAKLKQQDAIDAEKYMLGYTKALSKELSEANRHLADLYSVDNQSKHTRLSMEDSLLYAKAELSRRYLTGIIAKKLIKENGAQILDILKNK